MDRLTHYVKATIAEMRQVAWPTYSQTAIYTTLVIAISVAVALFIAFFDLIFTEFLSFIGFNF